MRFQDCKYSAFILFWVEWGASYQTFLYDATEADPQIFVPRFKVLASFKQKSCE